MDDKGERLRDDPAREEREERPQTDRVAARRNQRTSVKRIDSATRWNAPRNASASFSCATVM